MSDTPSDDDLALADALAQAQVKTEVWAYRRYAAWFFVAGVLALCTVVSVVGAALWVMVPDVTTAWRYAMCVPVSGIATITAVVKMEKARNRWERASEWPQT